MLYYVYSVCVCMCVCNAELWIVSTFYLQIDFKFFDLPDKGIIIPSFIFSAQGSSGLALQSLAMVIPNSELTLYLHQVNANIHPCLLIICLILKPL